MNFTTAIKTCFSKYVDWNGRALRSEYWYFYLFLMLGIFVTVLIDAVLGTSAFLGLFFLGTILPMFFVTIRRLHDVGRSGWWILLSMVPIASVVLLYWTIIEGDLNDNAYGPSPLDRSDVSETFS